MRSDKPCKYCERVTVNVELGRPIETMSDIPNTFDPASAPPSATQGPGTRLKSRA